MHSVGKGSSLVNGLSYLGQEVSHDKSPTNRWHRRLACAGAGQSLRLQKKLFEGNSVKGNAG